jgi:hypothetical protein
MRRSVVISLWSILGIVGLAAVLLAPFGMREIDKISGLNWVELASVGQTYEAVAALLAVPTFGGVVVSLFVQRREVQAGQEQTALLTQIELARIAMEYPDLAGADGTLPEQYSTDLVRQYTMINLSVSKWRSLFGLGHLSEGELRLLLGRIFVRPQARAWWESAGDSYGVGVHGGRKRFYEIAQEEYSHTAVPGSGKINAPRNRQAPGRPGRDLAKTGVVCLAAAATGAISGWLIARNRRWR